MEQDVKTMTDDELRAAIEDHKERLILGLFAHIELRVRLHEAEYHNKGNSKEISDMMNRYVADFIKALKRWIK